MTQPDVTIGLCLLNPSTMASTAIDSIAKQDYPHSSMKLVIVCEKNDHEVLEKLAVLAKKTNVNVTVLSSEGTGLGASRQIAVDNADGKYLVWVDDDFVLKKDFVTKHIEFMESKPQVGAALAKEIPRKEIMVVQMESYLGLLANSKTPPTGGFEIFRLDAIREAGGYDKNIRGAGEDIDIAKRIKQIGWQLVRNENAVYTRKRPPPNLRKLWRKHFWYGYGNHFLFHKYRNPSVAGELFFPSAFWFGLKASKEIYQINHEMDVFLLSPYCCFRGSARFFGFFLAHTKNYGHRQQEK